MKKAGTKILCGSKVLLKSPNTELYISANNQTSPIFGNPVSGTQSLTDLSIYTIKCDSTYFDDSQEFELYNNNTNSYLQASKNYK